MMMNFKARGITKEIDRFLKANDFDCRAKLDTDFCYYYNKSVIGYPVVMQEKMDLWFTDFAKSLGLEVDCGVFILSLFHEIGHNETLDLIDDEIYDYCVDVKETLSDSYEDTQTYFRLEDELQATQWAVDYINENAEMIQKFANRLEKEFIKFYKKVKVED